MEIAHRPPEDLEALRGIDARIKIGIGAIDVKVNHVETPEEVARADCGGGSGTRAGTSALGSSRLRILDAEAQRGGSQDRGARAGSRSVFGPAAAYDGWLALPALAANEDGLYGRIPGSHALDMISEAAEALRSVEVLNRRTEVSA